MEMREGSAGTRLVILADAQPAGSFYETEASKRSHSPRIPRSVTAPRGLKKIRARRKIPNGPRDQDLTAAGLRERARSDMNADATDVVPTDLDLSRVDRRSEAETELVDLLGPNDGGGWGHASCRTQ
jgi:hypothetical protein